MENTTNTNIGNTGVETSTTDNDAKTYTQAELDSILQRESDRRVTEALKKYEKKAEDKIKEAERLATMDANEKMSYELDKREKALAEKERQLTLSENKSTCASILNEKNIPIQLADLVVDENAEIMQEKIKILDTYFANAVKEEVNKRLVSKTPKAGGVSKEVGITKDTFKKMSIVDRQNLYNTDKDLYEALSK